MTRFLSVGAKLSLAFVAVAAVALGVVYIGVVPLLQRNLSEAKLDQFTRLALGEWRSFPAGSDFGLGNAEYRLEVSQYLQDAAATTNARVVLLSPLASSQLRVLGDSRETSSAPDVSADQVALGAVLAARPVSDVVTRDGKRYAEVAVPVQTGTLDTTVLLFVSPLEDTLATVDLVKKRMLIAGGIALLLAVLLGYGGASWFSRRVKKLERAANRIALGELGEPVVDSGADELSELAMAFERMRQRLVQLEHARREFIANASHELRTPLFSLGGFLELLDDEDLDEDTRREFLVTMQGQVERLTKLATDLLDLSRLDAGRLHITLEPIDLAAVAEALASEFAALALGSDHPITVDADEHARAVGDDERVLQVGRGLVENALRHTPSGTPIRIRVRGDSDQAVLEIQDGGPGIPPEHLAHVFERFYRIEGAQASGSGLGLAIARELAQAMGGTLEVESRPGRTVFSLSLPVSVLPAEAEEPVHVLS
jgi:signal transduction histidine kinase